MSLNSLSYNNAQAGSDVEFVMPNSMKSSKLAYPMLPSCKSRVAQVPASNGTSMTSGGVIVFQVPNIGVYKRASGYVRMKVWVSTANATFKALTGASAMFNRITLSSGGIIENLINYDYYANYILTNNTCQSYFDIDAAIMELANGIQIVFGAANAVEVCVPLMSNVLGNQNKSLPLFLLSQPLNIEINLNSIGRALYGVGVTEYTISNPVFCYEQILPGADYENAVRQSIAQSGAYNFQFDSYLGHTASIAAGSSLSFNAGVGKESCSAIIVGEVLTGDLSAVANANIGNVLRNSAAGDMGKSLLVDGVNCLPFNINQPSTQLIECQRASNSIFDTLTTYCGDPSAYGGTNAVMNAAGSGGFWAGFNLRTFDDAEVVSGLKVLNFQLSKSLASTDGATFFIYCLHKANLRITADGVVGVQS
jgi:hypothetical protein